MRRQVIAGNWKMNKTIGETRELCLALLAALGGMTADGGRRWWSARRSPRSLRRAETLEGSGIGLGAQNMFWRPSGALHRPGLGPDAEGCGLHVT